MTEPMPAGTYRYPNMDRVIYGLPFAAALGLPGTLRAVGVTADQLDTIAEGSMHDRMVHTNPRRIDGPTVVRALLDAAW